MCSLLLIVVLHVVVCCAAATPPSKPSQSDADNWRALSSFAQAQQDGATIPVGSCEPNLGPPVLNAVPDTAYFTGLKAPSPAYGGPQRAPGQHVVATGMQGTTEAPQPGQGIFDDFPADDSEAQQQHSGNETATEAEREYIGDESTGYCFNEHGNVIAVFAAYPVIEPLIVCALILLSITINDDSDPARNDPRDEFDSAPFTPVNDRRARDVSPGAERSRAPMRRNITAPARMMGSSPEPVDRVDVYSAPAVHARTAVENLFNLTGTRVMSIPSDGDCLYECIRLAFEVQDVNIYAALRVTGHDRFCGGSPPVCQMLRNMCASEVNDSIFQLFRACSEASGDREWRFMEDLNIQTTESLRLHMRLCGGKVWATEFEIGTSCPSTHAHVMCSTQPFHCPTGVIARALNAVIVIADQRYNDFKRIGPVANPSYFIFIKRNPSGIHYNLIKFPWCYERQALAPASSRNDCRFYRSLFRADNLPPELWDIVHRADMTI